MNTGVVSALSAQGTIDPVSLPTGAARPLASDLKARLAETPRRVMDFGHAPLDASFSTGGLAAGVHQAAGEGAAAFGFALAIAARVLRGHARARALLIETSQAAGEDGFAYAPGLKAMGLDPDRLGVVRVRREAEALRVMDEGLRSGAVAVVVAGFGDGAMLDLSITRRFNLSARDAGSLAVLVTPNLEATSAALSRWRLAPGRSRGRRRRLGRPVFELSLLRNRFGPVGDWSLEWDSDSRLFRPAPPLSAPVVRPTVDRSDPADESTVGRAAGAYRQAV